ncbi:MAG: hypothetical protein K6C14_06770 [Eubacterium sp.]|nr:hypothetical protein [Eubacterium sp.]
MAEYSYSDINDAKRRVQEMKNKAREYAPENADKASLLTSLTSNKDKAFVLSLLYLSSTERADGALLNAIINILFN